MHDDRVLVEKRIERELWQRVLPHMYRMRVPLSVEAWHAPAEPVPYAEAVTQRFEPIAVGARWGRPWGTTWFRLSGEIPSGWAGPHLEAIIDLGFGSRHAGFQAEGLVWLDGEPLQGVHPRRQGVPLPQLADGPCSFLVEGAANPMLGAGFKPSPLGSLATAGDLPLYSLVCSDLALRDDEVVGLCLDVEVLVGVMGALDLRDPRRHRLLRQLERAFDTIDPDRVSATAAEGRRVLAPALSMPARASSMRVIGVGHAHIDTAWLWPLRETVRKCARTFASAVRLMDDDPDYRFVCSQAVQYQWMEEHYPALFERIRTKVAAGQFVPVGGMWVEADMNLPSGESLVRQLIHGQRYFQSRFGVRCREVWIPDVFGYPASMPQVYAAAGCERFVTQKLSWNKQNRFPHNTFWWEGIDGTRVLTHFPPVDTYNAEVTGAEMAFSQSNFQDHGWSDWALMPFGYGNGGGGPTREMLGRAHRMADLDGAPRLTLGTSDEFFDHLDDEIAAGAPVPVWRGELYFEMHRGTLTSQIETKVGNRRCERLLREAELWWASADAVPAEVRAAVQAELDELWKAVLVQQFHDIIPGSSIAWVHADAEREHARIADRLESLIADALARAGAGAAAGAAVRQGDAPQLPMSTGLLVANAATHARTEVIDVEDAPVVVHVPGSGLASLVPVGLDEIHHVVVTEHSMANGLLALQWDLDGTITSIIDVVRGRELLPAGRTVSFDLAVDQPVEYDAWDVEAWTVAGGVPIGGVTNVAMVEADPLRARLEVSRSFGDSMMTTTYVLRAGSARLDIEIDVDWHEHERLLSLMVPLDVRAAEATCDIQFGLVRRPTHPSSPWDAAKFEVCAHRFVDLAEPGFGVAVLNDGRFGHSLFDGGIRVSLLRGARFPDPDADQGRHRVTIAVLPHGPGLHEVLREAEALNMPLRVVPSGGTVAAPVVTIDHPGVLISAVKRADDGSGDLIVRLHEACGDRAEVQLRTAAGIRSAQWCDALEEPRSAIDVTDTSLALTLRPFQLATLRLVPGTALPNA
ncbi:MAG: glycoside hydrolase family 38 C-terminal domain-containing protein [Ilumatobacteraceae bacterium]